MEEIIWGKETGDLENDQYISISIDDDSEHICINFFSLGHVCEYHFTIKDVNSYNDFKTNLTCMFDDCESVYDAEEMFNESDSFVYEYLDDYEELDQEMRTEEEIHEFMNQASDMIWLARKQNMFYNMLLGIEGVDASTLDGCNKAIDEICQRYDIDFKEPISDWENGYWNGILVALSWIMGGEIEYVDDDD